MSFSRTLSAQNYVSTDIPDTGPIDEAVDDLPDELEPAPLEDLESEGESVSSEPEISNDETEEVAAEVEEETVTPPIEEEFPAEDEIIETPLSLVPDTEIEEETQLFAEDLERVEIEDFSEPPLEVDQDEEEEEFNEDDVVGIGNVAFDDELSPILDEQDADDDLELSAIDAIPLPPPPNTLKPAASRKKKLLRLWAFVKFCLFMLALFLIVGVIGGVGVYFYCLPRYELAQSLDMSKIDDLEVASKIFDRNGKELGRIYVQNRHPVPYESVSENFTNALLAAEDSRFHTHNGVDPKGLLRVLFQAIKTGEVNQGASTITQQLARNAFDMRERSISRKVTEAFLAWRIEKEIADKNKIMELYMNRIYFGDGYYGIASAAEGFFGKKASDLTIAEAATLAGVIRNPYYRGPRKFPAESKNTRDSVIRRMLKLDFIEENQSEAAINQPITTIPKKNQTGRSKYVYDRVRQQVIEQLGYETVSQGGYTIRTTIDIDVQQKAEEKLRSQLDEVEKHPDFKHQTLAQYKELKKEFSDAENGSQPPNPTYLQGSLLMIENKTGAIVALVGGRDFSDSMFDRTSMGRRPSGTAFLPFVYASAFESGKFPGSLVADTPMDQSNLQIGGLTGIVAEWGPEDLDNTYENSITYRRALSKSAIGATVKVGTTAKLDNIVDLAKSVGMSFDGDLQNFNATMVGRNVVSMSELCEAYTIFPNNGDRPEATYLIESITDANGIEIFKPEKRMTNRPAIDKYSAFQVTSCLQDSLKTGSAKKATEEYGLGDYPAAGKTGTEYGFTDNWFVGYTSEVTCAVWAGFDKTEQIYPLAFSADTVLPVWTDVMNAAKASYPPQEFTPPSDAAEVEVCTHSGELATNDCFEIVQNGTAATQVRTTFIEYLRPGTEVKSICSIHARPGSQVLTGAGRLTLTGNNKRPQPIRVSLVGADLGEPIIPMAMTVVGEDPYASVVPVVRAKVALPHPDEETDDPEAIPGEENPDDPEAINRKPLRAVPVQVNSSGLPVVRPILEDDPIEPVANRVRLAPPPPIMLDGIAGEEPVPVEAGPAISRPISEDPSPEEEPEPAIERRAVPRTGSIFKNQ